MMFLREKEYKRSRARNPQLSKTLSASKTIILKVDFSSTEHITTAEYTAKMKWKNNT